MSRKQWRKLGLIFAPGAHDWMKSHAQNPLPEALGGGLFRVHFAGRDNQNRARGGYFVFDIKAPRAILEVSSTPTLDLGELGAFDDAGVMPGVIVERNYRKFMFYTGWSRTVDVPFAFHIGLATCEDESQIYQRASRAPVLGRNHFDPFIVGGPYVLFEENKFKMWYTSCTRWVKDQPDSKPRHFYTVKYADSLDGISWNCSDHLCLGYEGEEYALARPVVWHDGDIYHMWFTYRGGENTYRLGTATSANGIDWQRDKDELGIALSPDGWDSEMLCYAHPLIFEGRTYALYNGNGFGADGIGLALYEA